MQATTDSLHISNPTIFIFFGVVCGLNKPMNHPKALDAGRAEPTSLLRRKIQQQSHNRAYENIKALDARRAELDSTLKP